MSTTYQLGVAPGRFPWLSHAFLMLRQPLKFLTSLRDVGDIVKVRIGTEWAYFVQHPELLRQVLVTDLSTFDKGGALVDKARVLIGNGLGTCPNAEHPRQRRLLQPLFSHARLAGYATVMRDEASSLADSWRPGQVVEVRKAMATLSLSIATRTMFSTEAGAEMVTKVQQALPVVVTGLYYRMIAPIGLMQMLPIPSNRRFDEALTQLQSVVNKITEDYRRAGVDHGDLLSALLAARDADTAKGLTSREIYDQVMTVLVGGTENISSVLTWALYLLGLHPEIEQRLHAEVDDVLAGRPAGFDDLVKLEYTRRVITETLRLYPAGWFLTRRTNAETELGGHRLAPGTHILFSPYTLHRNPEFFPDPERFDPDRWLPDRAKTVPRCAMIPFSLGTRKCIGDTFSTNQAAIILSTLTGRWRLRPIPGTKVRVLPRTTLQPDSLPMRVESHVCGSRRQFAL
jgi:cytochrome P450